MEYYGIRADFQTDDPGWKFWRYFVDLSKRAEEAAAGVVFQGENDLVVNTASMAVLATLPGVNLIAPERILDFDAKDKVFHTVYFRQERTVEFIRDCFELEKRTRAGQTAKAKAAKKN